MNRNFMLRAIIWFLEGAVVGFGAIMPGISGGAPVSYTHLDVYKRQIMGRIMNTRMNTGG